MSRLVRLDSHNQQGEGKAQLVISKTTAAKHFHMCFLYCSYNSRLGMGSTNSCRILYSNSVVQLLRPLLEYEGLASAGIDEIIWQHAQTGVFLLDQHYR